ncbi:MAG: hypothetical protein AB7N24_09205 [Dehalococcoidia bacterium]
MSNKQALHELIETLEVGFVDDVLDRIREELAAEVPALSVEGLKSIIRGLEEAVEGRGVFHEEAMRLVGLDP